MILVTGAAGKTGRAVIQALIEKKQQLRAFVFRDDQIPMLKKMGVRDFVVGDLRSRTKVDQAVRAVRAIYHICPNMQPDEVRIGQVVINAAQSAGVARFVYHSVLHPQIEAMPHHWHKLRVEQMLCESGLSWTILQPVAYMQNIFTQWDQIVEQGVYTVPYALDKRLSMVDLLDVAAAAAVVITEKGHQYAIYELCGPDTLSGNEIAAMLAHRLGRDIKALVIALDLWEVQAQAAGLSAYAIETLVKMFRHYQQHDFRGNPRVLGWLLGRSAAPFEQFLDRELPALI